MSLLKRIAVVGVLAVLVACTGACSDEKTKPQEVIRPVVTMRVPDRAQERHRSFPGTSQAAIETKLSFRVAGEIEELPAKIGMQVKQGDLVARLDPTDYKIQVGRAEAAVAQAEAALAQAKADWERTRALYEVGNTSRRDLDRARAQFDASTASLSAVSQQLALARQQLRYTVLRAPVDGAVAEVPVDVHQTVAAGTPIALLTAGKRMQMEVGIPDSLISHVSVGDVVFVSFDAVPSQTFTGSVVEVGVESRVVSTYPVKVALRDTASRVRPGMSGEVAFTFTSDRQFIYVPPVAVIGENDGGRHVWVVDESTGIVSRRDVKTGELTPRGLEVLDGLETGELLVVRGVNRIQDGMRVRVMKEPHEEVRE